MKSTLVKIGNSRGVRIPKAMLEQCRLEGAIEMAVEHDCLVIRAAPRPRENWAAAFEEATRDGADELLDDGGPPTAWERSEWEW